MSSNRVRISDVESIMNFALRSRFPPPLAWPAPLTNPSYLEVEINQAMNKLIFSLTLNLRANAASTVAYLDWVPSYFRSSSNRQVLHELPEEDADASWRLACRCWASTRPSTSQCCELRFRSSEGQQSWALSALEAETFRTLVDHRRNHNLRPLTQ
ncbi:unnamed protein product [Symbiodinium pilosum]|uniref:Uncharacterized protein n=1 Tax=Symbiodinium pilosum TaxID=2952 RepID=A0A812TD92_SYMPI|nr:unnamed protein product [Symbiodinium pilosum]